MSGHPQEIADPVVRATLALRNIEGNLCFTDHEAWAWFVLPTQPWAFRSDTQREQLLYGAGDALAWLAGHRLHLRVTTRPYPADEWAQRARRADTRTADATGTVVPGPTTSSPMQQHLRHQTMAEKQVFLGVRLTIPCALAPAHRCGVAPTGQHRTRPAAVSARAGRPRRSRLPGMEGRPATAAEIEWLLRRSVGLGLPAPVELSPIDLGASGTPDDLHSLTDRSRLRVLQPFGRTVQVTGQVGTSPVERHVAVLSVGRLEEIDAPDAAHEPWLSHTDRLPFPVEWSAQFDVLSGDRGSQGGAAQAPGRPGHAASLPRARPRRTAGTGPSGASGTRGRGPDDAWCRGGRCPRPRMVPPRGLRPERGGVPRARPQGHVRPTADDECSIEHPRGQYGLLREFIPGEPVSTSAYRRRLPVLYVAAGVPAASSQLGDRRGPYVGYTAGSSRRAVMFDTHYATEEKETSGLVPVVGGLGAGQECSAGADHLRGRAPRHPVRRPRPLGPAGAAHRAAGAPRAQRAHRPDHGRVSGTLNPFAVVAGPHRERPTTADDAFAEAQVLAAQDRKLLAIDVVKMLLPPVAGQDSRRPRW